MVVADPWSALLQVVDSPGWPSITERVISPK
jgi:hypothetical protein